MSGLPAVPAARPLSLAARHPDGPIDICQNSIWRPLTCCIIYCNNFCTRNGYFTIYNGIFKFNFLAVVVSEISAVSSLGINEYTRRACDAPVNSRKPRVSGGRGSRVEQSAGRCHFVAIGVDIQETAEDRTVCSESIAPPRLTLFFTARAARTSFRSFSFLLCKVS